jgi:hypothetical protein
MKSSRNPVPRIIVAFAAACLAQACSSKSNPPAVDAGTVIFPATFRQAGFQLVRPCRAPGEHSALNGFTVWVNDDAAASYDAILLGGGDAGVHTMPDGAIVVKELYQDRTCTAVDRWVAMKKIAGFDPAHGDWFWQDVSAMATVNAQGVLPSCSDCHEGRPDNTCIGYGNTNGMDYLCTAP